MVSEAESEQEDQEVSKTLLKSFEEDVLLVLFDLEEDGLENRVNRGHAHLSDGFKLEVFFNIVPDLMRDVVDPFVLQQVRNVVGDDVLASYPLGVVERVVVAHLFYFVHCVLHVLLATIPDQGSNWNRSLEQGLLANS